MISGFILLTLAIMALITSLTLINRVGIDIIADMILIIVGFSVIILSVSRYPSLTLSCNVFFLDVNNSFFITFDESD